MDDSSDVHGCRSAPGVAGAHRAVLDGRLAPPDDFDAERLWAPSSTGTVDVPDLSAPYLSVREALTEVCRVTGLDFDAVLVKPRGRRGNPANWLAAWWMSRGCGIDHGAISRALGTSHAGVSQRVKQVDDRRWTDERVAAWVRALQSGNRKA